MAIGLRFLTRLSLACFVSLLLTISGASVASPRVHYIFATLEWTEMAAGTVGAFLSLVVLGFASRTGNTQPEGKSRWLVVLGSALWALFWIVALLARPWRD